MERSTSWFQVNVDMPCLSMMILPMLSLIRATTLERSTSFIWIRMVCMMGKGSSQPRQLKTVI